jgi:hypothetical protein
MLNVYRKDKGTMYHVPRWRVDPTSEGDYRRTVLLARLCAIGGKDVVW